MCIKQAAGTVLYKVLWEGWPEELATREEEDDIPAPSSTLGCTTDDVVANRSDATAATQCPQGVGPFRG